MKYFFWKRTILITLLICTGGMVFSCRSQKQPKLEAEVELANKSVYVWNRGTQAWAGGIVFLNERSLKIQKPFGTVNPQGFAQLPLREFKQDLYGSKLRATPQQSFPWSNKNRPGEN